jgi:CRISPR-associated protein Cas1
MKCEGGRYVVQKKDEVLAEIPSAKVEAVVIMRGAHVTSMVCDELLAAGVPMTYVDVAGKFKGRLESVLHHNIERQVLQFERYGDAAFCLGAAKKIIAGKLNNSRVVLRRYNRTACDGEVKGIIRRMDAYESGVASSKSVQQLCGYEGMFSKLYFDGLSRLVRDEFRFSGRSKRPPRDAFNSLLSFGYTLLMNEIYTSLTHKGLSPYIGFMHRVRNGHPALASDMMEEWRPLIVDSMVMKLVNGGTFKTADFNTAAATGGVYLNREDSKTFIRHFETRLLQTNQYIGGTAAPMTFRDTLRHQIDLLVRALNDKNPDLYSAIMIR